MKDFIERLKNLPTWQKVTLALGLVAVIGFALYMRNKASTAQTPPTTANSGLLNGGGTGYDIYGNPLFNNGYSGLSGGGLAPPGFQGPPQSGGNRFSFSVRQPGAAGAWDSSHSGVPLRDSPGGQGNIIGYIPWGTSISPLGSAVTGSVNQAGGSTQWLPVSYGGQQGYVSVFDVLGSGTPGRTVNA